MFVCVGGSARGGACRDNPLNRYKRINPVWKLVCDVTLLQRNRWSIFHQTLRTDGRDEDWMVLSWLLFDREFVCAANRATGTSHGMTCQNTTVGRFYFRSLLLHSYKKSQRTCSSVQNGVGVIILTRAQLSGNCLGMRNTVRWSYHSFLIILTNAYL